MMKKFFAILALVATVFASCGKDDDNDDNKLAQVAGQVDGCRA